jgi:hypothetical protein
MVKLIKIFNYYSKLKNLNLTARTSEIVDTRTSELVDIGQMPTSCADLERMGQKVNGLFLVKGSKKMEMIYCNFFANQNGTTCAILLVIFGYIVCLIILFYRQTEMDRIRRRQIGARPFLRPERFFI